MVISVLAAFQKLNNFDRFVVPPNCAETGALGIALYAAEKVRQFEKKTDIPYQTRFIGLDADLEFNQKSLLCKGCENYCDVSMIITADMRKIYDGMKCEKIFSNQKKRVKEPTSIDRSREVMLSK